jgi:uncharacterized membrane protein
LESSIKNVVSNLSVLILSVGFLGVGMVKMVNHPQTIQSFVNWGMPSWSMYVIGLFELCLAIALFYKPTRLYAIYATALHMLGAFSVHLYHQEYDQFYGPAMVTVLITALFFAEK